MKFDVDGLIDVAASGGYNTDIGSTLFTHISRLLYDKRYDEVDALIEEITSRSECIELLAHLIIFTDISMSTLNSRPFVLYKIMDLGANDVAAKLYSRYF